jgi:acetate kinase
MKVLVINSGSSSIKFQYVEMLHDRETILLKGMIDCIGFKGCTVKMQDKQEPCTIKTHEEGIQYILSHVPKNDIDVVGHRVVHGGEIHEESVIITDDVIKNIEILSDLAPLHNPANLAGILACKKILPDIPQVAVFDTAFHVTIPKEAYMYAIPRKYYEKYGVRKYGFHGTSHHYILSETMKLLGKNKINIISCHLGNGSSICAIKDNKSIDTSMGFTPMAGVMMGTRSGDVDPGVITFLQEKEKLTFDEIEKTLNKDSGLLGITGSNDMRTIWEASKNGDEKSKAASRLAMDMLAYSIVKYIGAYAAVLGRVDAIVFTGGLGENAFYIRKKVIDYLEPMGVLLDDLKNERNERTISRSVSTIKVLVIPTNEELMIAKEAAYTLDIAKYLKKKTAIP